MWLGVSLEFVVVCPGNAMTGGIELLHQLVDIWNNNGHISKIAYYPFFRRFEIPPAYAKYNIRKTDVRKIDIQNSAIIIPETYTHLTGRFSPSRTLVWWMSVDNYRNSRSALYALKNFVAPWNYVDINRSGSFNALACNLYQSEYARSYLSQHGVENVAPLSDYINRRYLEASRTVSPERKEDVVVYNPAKGAEKTKILMQSLPGYRFVPIQNMSADQVADLLAKSKVYIDFGNHPGKDRIPREAAISGCVVITNRQGAAANPVDIPIDEAYKLDDASSGFTASADALLSSVMKNFMSHYERLAGYRAMIASEEDEFKRSALRIAELMQAKLTAT